MKIQKPIQYLIAYTTWIIFIALGTLTIFLGRSGVTGLLTLYYVQEKFQRRMEVQFIDRVILLVPAFGLLIAFIVVEQYFRHGVQRGTIFRRILRVMGIEILGLFGAHLAYVALTSFPPEGILALVIEFIVGAGMVVVSSRMPDKPKL